MRHRDASKLKAGDDVEVCLSRKDPQEWTKGTVRGEPVTRKIEGMTPVLEFTVDTVDCGLLFAIPHTALR